jgi:hypothetical protein
MSGAIHTRLVLSLDLEADFKATKLVYDVHFAPSAVFACCRARNYGRPRAGADCLLLGSGSQGPFASSLSRRTILMVLRMSASLKSAPIVDAIARNRALNSR